VNAADPEVVDKVKKLTNGGVDYAIEMAGSTRAFETAYRITRRGGTTVTAGLPHPNATWPMPATHLVAEERTIKGSYIGTCVPARDLPRYIDLYRAGKLPVNKLMTGRIKLEQINEGFDLLHEGKAVRQVVTF
jgi:alcohol dehydrogenase